MSDENQLPTNPFFNSMFRGVGLALGEVVTQKFDAMDDEKRKALFAGLARRYCLSCGALRTRVGTPCRDCDR